MSQYYITSTEGTGSGTSISVNRINELAKNHPSSSITSNTQTNSKISDLGNIYYNYLFSQKITSLNKKPIKFSDFNTSMFFAIDVSMIPEYPEKYGRYNNGQLKITPIGGTGAGFSAKIGYGVMQKLASTGNSTFVEKQIYVNRTFSSGDSVETRANLDYGTDYFAYVEELNTNFTVIKSYTIKNILVGWDYSRTPIVSRYYFRR